MESMVPSRNNSMTLKSVLKEPSIAHIPTSSFPRSDQPATLQRSIPAARRVRGLRRPAPELGYKRVVSSQARKSNGDRSQSKENFPGQASIRHQSPQKLPQKSCLMPEPQQNERKRSASSLIGGGDGPKSTKAPRTSLHFKGTGNGLPDSTLL